MTKHPDRLADALAGLSEEEFAEIHGYAQDAAYNIAGDLLSDRLAQVGVEFPRLPTELDEAVASHYDALLDVLDAENDRRIDLRFHCLDCDVHTGEIGQYPYGCPDDLWHAVVPGGRRMLCLACLAKRLDAAGLPWPWSKPVEQLAAELLELQTSFDDEDEAQWSKDE